MRFKKVKVGELQGSYSHKINQINLFLIPLIESPESNFRSPNEIQQNSFGSLR